MKRQALYACLTCRSQSVNGLDVDKDDESSLAGVCLACSYKCHEGHSLVELYTKRNFRCDCGNSKFAGIRKCTLIAAKDPTNDGNAYNQNFTGLYCVCKRPYPDPEDDVNDEMVQCALCEDWYHFRHLANKISVPENYSELICQLCVEKYHFLKYYTNLIHGYLTEEVVDVEGTSSECKLPKTKIEDKLAAFMVFHWREKLCTCVDCVKMYQEYGIDFVTDPEDMVQFYEEKGKTTEMPSQFEAGMEALSSLDRVKQIEAISEYNDMKNHLKEYLQKFVDSKKIVREDDIKEFFANLNARKKQKVEVPTHCR